MFNIRMFNIRMFTSEERTVARFTVSSCGFFLLTFSNVYVEEPIRRLLDRRVIQSKDFNDVNKISNLILTQSQQTYYFLQEATYDCLRNKKCHFQQNVRSRRK